MRILYARWLYASRNYDATAAVATEPCIKPLAPPLEISLCHPPLAPILDKPGEGTEISCAVTRGEEWASEIEPRRK